MIKKTTPLFILCFLVSGCASNTLKPEEATKYKGVTINNFLKERYPYKRFESSGFLKKSHDMYSPSEPLMKHHVIYSASFNKVNYKHLYRPYQEVNLLCRVNDGVLINTKPYMRNPIKRYSKQDWIRLEEEGVPKNPYISFPSANRAAHFDRKDNEVLLSAIRKDKIFGLFSCTKDGNSLWRVRMTPIAYYPRINAVTTVSIDIETE